jgi:hypothetical protein
MCDQEKKQEPTSITPQPDAENKKESGELTKEELEKATGGFEFTNILITSIPNSGSTGGDPAGGGGSVKP